MLKNYIRVFYAIYFLFVIGNCYSMKQGCQDVNCGELKLQIESLPSYDKIGNFVYSCNNYFSICMNNLETNIHKELEFSSPVYFPKLGKKGNELYYISLAPDSYHSEFWKYNLITNQKEKISAIKKQGALSLALSSDFVAFLSYDESISEKNIYFSKLKEGYSGDSQLQKLTIKLKLAEPKMEFIGASYLAVLDGKSISIYDLAKNRLKKEYILDFIPYYFSPQGYFVGFVNKYYQVFRVNHEEDNIEQLTYDGSHKLLPYLGIPSFLRFFFTKKNVSD